jgi:hypothetical protein
MYEEKNQENICNQPSVPTRNFCMEFVACVVECCGDFFVAGKLAIGWAINNFYPAMQTFLWVPFTYFLYPSLQIVTKKYNSFFADYSVLIII